MVLDSSAYIHDTKHPSFDVKALHPTINLHISVHHGRFVNKTIEKETSRLPLGTMVAGFRVAESAPNAANRC